MEVFEIDQIVLLFYPKDHNLVVESISVTFPDVESIPTRIKHSCIIDQKEIEIKAKLLHLSSLINEKKYHAIYGTNERYSLENEPFIENLPYEVNDKIKNMAFVITIKDGQIFSVVPTNSTICFGIKLDKAKGIKIPSELDISFIGKKFTTKVTWSDTWIIGDERFFCISISDLIRKEEEVK